MLESVPVDAVCVGCGETHTARVPLSRLRDGVEPPSQPDGLLDVESGDFVSFKSKCNRCGSQQWHNAVAVLSAFLKDEVGADAE